MSNDVMRVDAGTGEVIPFDPKSYLAALDERDATEDERGL